MAQDWSISPTPAKPQEHQVLLLSYWRPAQLDAARLLTQLSPTQCSALRYPHHQVCKTWALRGRRKVGNTMECWGQLCPWGGSCRLSILNLRCLEVRVQSVMNVFASLQVSHSCC